MLSARLHILYNPISVKSIAFVHRTIILFTKQTGLASHVTEARAKSARQTCSFDFLLTFTCSSAKLHKSFSGSHKRFSIRDLQRSVFGLRSQRLYVRIAPGIMETKPQMTEDRGQRTEDSKPSSVLRPPLRELPDQET
jgi:hypothetical protein